MAVPSQAHVRCSPLSHTEAVATRVVLVVLVGHPRLQLVLPGMCACTPFPFKFPVLPSRRSPSPQGAPSRAASR